MNYWLVEEKYDDFLRKNANIRGESGNFFTVPRGKNIIFWASIHPYTDEQGTVT